MKRMKWLLLALCSLVIGAGVLAAGNPARLSAAAPAPSELAREAAAAGVVNADGSRTLPADVVPQDVRSGAAQMTGPHAQGDQMQVLFMLPLRDPAGLDAYIGAADDPHSSRYNQYLSEAEVTARFGPTAANAQSVETWLRAAGIADIQTPADRLYVRVHASTAQLDQLLGVQINDYKVADRTFFAPDRAPTLPAAVSGAVQWVVGLDSDSQIHTFMEKARASGSAAAPAAHPQDSPPYGPTSFRDAYDTNPLLNAGFTGSGANIAITLWSLAPSDDILSYWADQVGVPAPTHASGRLEYILTDGVPSQDGDDGEAALDIESIDGMAPASHIRYYEATQPQNADLAIALDQAGSDATNRIISNSWGGPETTNAHQAMDSILAAHSASGHNYFFSSGDDGSWAAGQDPYPDFPTSSQYVVSVGGTAFASDVNGSWPGETTWVYDPTGNNGNPEGSGGGYSLVTARPSWQTGPGTGGTHRGYPDIAAEGDPNTGAFVCDDVNLCYQVGGTSLAAPLWAGMTLITDQYLVAQGRPHLGFLAPTLYALAAGTQAYPAFHDITVGTNGAYNAAPHWDAVTGIGSPDLWNLARDLAAFSPPTPVPSVTASRTPTRTPTRTPAPTQTPGGPTPTPGGCGLSFSDVHPTDYFYTPVMYLACHGAIAGYGDGTFRPFANTTRGQLSKIIVGAEGWAIDTTGGPHFTDVPTTNPFYPFIETAYHHGIISGYSDGTFRWGANVTRGQLSKIIVGAQGWATNTSGGPHFSDVPTTNPFYAAIETAYNHGIISGYSDGTFRWGANATRGQISKIVYLAINPAP